MKGWKQMMQWLDNWIMADSRCRKFEQATDDLTKQIAELEKVVAEKQCKQARREAVNGQ